MAYKNQIMQYFNYDLLPEESALVSDAVFQLAWYMESTLRNSPEKSAGMRKLLEAKDCFVRAALTLKDE